MSARIGDRLMLGRKKSIASRCDQIVFWSLFSLLLLYPLTVNPFLKPVYYEPKLLFLRAASLIIGLAWAVKILQKGEIRFRAISLNIPLAVFGLVVIISFFNSIHRLTSLFGDYKTYDGLFTYLGYLLLGLAAANFIWKEEERRLLFKGLLYGACLVSILGILEYSGIQSLPAGHIPGQLGTPILSTFGNSVMLGAYLSLVLPLSVVLFLDKSQRHIFGWLLPTSIILMFPALLFSGDRGAWLGVAISLIFIFTFSKILREKKFQRAILIIAIITVVLALAIVFVSSSQKKEFLAGRLTSLLTPAEIIRTPSVWDRLMIWKTTFSIVPQYPVLGTGPDALGLVFAQYKTPAYARWEWGVGAPPTTSKAHNEPLQIAATLGLLGLAAYLWIIVVAFYKLIAQLFPPPLNPLPQGEGKFGFSSLPLNWGGTEWGSLALLASLIAHFIQLQFTFSHITFAPVLWIILGMAFSESDSEWAYPLEVPSGIKWVISLTLIGLTLFGLIFFTRVYLADVNFTKAIDYEQRRKVDEAISQYQKATDLYPYEERYWHSLGNAYTTKAQFQQNPSNFRIYFHEASKAFEKAQKTNPWDELSYFYAGYAYHIAGGALEDRSLLVLAESNHRQALSLNPYSVPALMNIGATLASLGSLDEGIEKWQRAKWLNPKEVNAYYNLGLAYEDKGLLKRAVSEYKALLKIDPNFVDARRALERLGSL